MINTMLAKKVWAVVGANDRPNKFGNKIYKKLKARGYTIYAVNPGCKTVDGDICYPDLSSLPQVPEVIDMVLPPERGKSVLEEAAKLGINNIWLQPGSCDDELLESIGSLGLTAVQACVMVELGKEATDGIG